MATIEGSQQAVRVRLIDGLKGATDLRPVTQQPPGNLDMSLTTQEPVFIIQGAAQRHEGLIGVLKSAFAYLDAHGRPG
jgi:hypothetical protein